MKIPSFQIDYKKIIICLFCANTLQGYAQEDQSQTYNDGHGGKITLPLGDMSFADEVVSFKRGKPSAIESACDSSRSIYVPDFGGIAQNFTSLGCGGELVLQFTDNALVNIKGPDLYVFEVGKYIEPTQLYISKDAKNWINVGKISGGTSSVDIGDSIKQGEVFHYVKLVDLSTDCKGDWPGADIDAVAAIGSGKQISLSSTLLYKVNEFELMDKAKRELDRIVDEIKTNNYSKMLIEGHTDNTGDDAYNQNLSTKRANAVKKYIDMKLLPQKIDIRAIGYGSTIPISPNSNKEGQEKNRRVNLILIPD